MKSPEKNKLLQRRLAPLYVSSFFQGLIFWYCIEKLFMVYIGFTPTTIALSVIVIFLAGMLLDVPSGILADRWSRKGVLIISTSALGLASLFMGLSHSVVEYVVTGVLYAFYSSLYSGVFDAMLYDTVMEEQGTRNGYEKYLGYTSGINGVAMVIGSLAGGIIGHKVGLRTTYFISVPSGFLAAFALSLFREPKIHLQTVQTDILTQTKQTLASVFQKGSFIWILVAILFTTAVFDFMLEVDQLWPLALHMNIVLYGPLNALLLLGFAIGGPLAAVVMKSRAYIVISCLLGLGFVTLLVVRDMRVIALAECGTVSVFVALYTISLGKLHDAMPSSLRSGASSTAGMLSSALFIPLIFIFGWITQDHSVFTAAILLIPLALTGIVGLIVITVFRPHGLPTTIQPKPGNIPVH
jgi:MFS family permease